MKEKNALTRWKEAKKSQARKPGDHPTDRPSCAKVLWQEAATCTPKISKCKPLF